MMEIVYGPVILACISKSLAFGLLFALLVPAFSRHIGGAQMGIRSRIGLGLAATGLFGLAHLAVVCAADGFPPRIIQSTALALVLVTGMGAMLARQRTAVAG